MCVTLSRSENVLQLSITHVIPNLAECTLIAEFRSGFLNLPQVFYWH